MIGLQYFRSDNMTRKVKRTTVKSRKIKKAKQVRQNKDVGARFEGKITRYINDYLEDCQLIGIAYRFPSGKSQNQPIDILLDSEFGYFGIECKSIYTQSLSNGKIYFSKLGNVSKSGIHQVQKQHAFCNVACRPGVFAIQFRDLRQIYIVPHVCLYKIFERGDLFITVNYIQHNYPLLKSIDIKEYLLQL